MEIKMDFYPVKAQYRRGEEVWLCLELEKESATCSYERAVVSVFWMERLVRRVEVEKLCNAMEICVGAYMHLYIRSKWTMPSDRILRVSEPKPCESQN